MPDPDYDPADCMPDPDDEHDPADDAASTSLFSKFPLKTLPY